MRTNFSHAFHFRAVFYSKNVHAATTKHHATSKAIDQASPSTSASDFLFPVSGWSLNRKDLPVVSALTILGHLLKAGNAKPDDNIGEVLVVQSVDDVLALDPGFGMSMLQESLIFLRPDNVTVLVKKLTDQAASHGKHTAVSIFTTAPFSLAICSDCSHFYLFDSHSHGQSGALIAKVPVPQAVDYLVYFFRQRYPCIHFDNFSPKNPVGHLVFLTMDTISEY